MVNDPSLIFKRLSRLNLSITHFLCDLLVPPRAIPTPTRSILVCRDRGMWAGITSSTPSLTNLLRNLAAAGGGGL